MTGAAAIVVAGSADDWRAWLARNCRSADEVWLVLHHHDRGTPRLRYHEAVEQALCFGWIIGLHRGIAIAKRPDTRRRRIDQTVNLAALNIRANHPAARRSVASVRAEPREVLGGGVDSARGRSW
jgi:uncharacterized protein YdeI (YjbR/CyaY-like superfamily)